MLEETQKAKHYCAFLSGNITSDIKAYKHNILPLFGIGKENDEHYWNAVIRQVTLAGFLSKDIESFGILKLTAAGKEFLKNPRSFKLLKQHDFSNTDDDDSIVLGSKGGVFDEQLYDALIDLRKSIAKEMASKGITANVISIPNDIDENQVLVGPLQFFLSKRSFFTRNRRSNCAFCAYRWRFIWYLEYPAFLAYSPFKTLAGH